MPPKSAKVDRQFFEEETAAFERKNPDTSPTTAPSPLSSAPWPRRRNSSPRHGNWASAPSSTSCPTTSPTSTPGSARALAGGPERELFHFRPGRGEHGELPPKDWQSEFGTPTDLALGTRRARAAALLSLALPGVVYVYQGEELGLPEADIPLDRIEDPMHARSGGTDPGRDGCRVPLPWAAGEPHAGFGGEPWLPQPDGWAAYAADRQAEDPGSMLRLYREAVRLRPVFGDGPPTWLPAPDGVLAFARADALCVVNLSDTPVDLPAHSELLLADGPLDTAGRLPRDTAVRLRA